MGVLAFVLAAALALIGASSAWAQEYPGKVITLVVPFAAGGPTDTVAPLSPRRWAPRSSSRSSWRTSAAPADPRRRRVARATGDGYTLFLHHIGQSTAPALYRKLPVQRDPDFEPIGLVTDVPMTLVAKKDFPPKDFKDLMAYVKENKTRSLTPMPGSARPRISAGCCS